MGPADSSPAYLWPGYATRAATFENPSAAPGGGAGPAARKERPNKLLKPGERVVLSDLDGPGTVTHFWLTVGAPYPNDANPAFLRRQTLEVFYGERTEPSVSVPVPDFFGAVHGVCVSYASALTAVNEKRGFTSRIPMPFTDRIRIEYANHSDLRTGHRLVGFYRWHLSDPVVFQRDLTVTVQQIGFDWKGGYYDRQDDWCATAFTYCSEVQAVPRAKGEVST